MCLSAITYTYLDNIDYTVSRITYYTICASDYQIYTLETISDLTIPPDLIMSKQSGVEYDFEICSPLSEQFS